MRAKKNASLKARGTGRRRTNISPMRQAPSRPSGNNQGENEVKPRTSLCSRAKKRASSGSSSSSPIPFI